MKPTIVVITGPTCAGKSTLERLLCKETPFVRFISHTTRLPRVGEQTGEDYHFQTDEAYDKLEAEGRFLETVWVHGHRYGTSSEQLQRMLDAEGSPVIVMDPAGRASLIKWARMNKHPIVPVFLNSNPTTRASRYITRIWNDISTRGATTVEWLLDRHAIRLGYMLAEETKWQSHDHPNAIAIDDFDENSQKFAVAQIMAKVWVASAQSDRRVTGTAVGA